jgi:histidinol dehydrogenase
MSTNSVSVHDRGARQTSLVYSVLSRRSGGLSVGINLYPDRKRCNFDCPYCEVKPFEGEGAFSAAALAAELEAFCSGGYAESWSPAPVRDLCISGNGEPTISPHLAEALGLCSEVRRTHPDLLGAAPIVIITNGTGFLDEATSRMLSDFARAQPLRIWAKLDGWDQDWFSALSRSSFSLQEILGALAAFARSTPVTIQTMLCSLGGCAPGLPEARAYAARLSELLSVGAKLEAVQLYTLARAPAEALVRPLSDEALLAFSGEVTAALGGAIPVAAFGERGLGPLSAA